MNEIEITNAINKYNSLFLYFIMKAKKKYTNLYAKLSRENIRSIYENHNKAEAKNIFYVEAQEAIQYEVKLDKYKQVVNYEPAKIQQNEIDLIQIVESELVQNNPESELVQNNPESELVQNNHESELVQNNPESEPEQNNPESEPEQNNPESEQIYCVACEPNLNPISLPYNPELNSSCACCVLQIQTFPSYDELYECINLKQKNLFTKQIYFCTKIIFENKSNEELIYKMCTKILELEGIIGLDFVYTILKSL